MNLLPLMLMAALTLFAAGEYSNRRAPGFSLADSHFQQHDPQDYRGKVLIVDFMQTTCAVCQRLTDTLVQVKAKYGDKIGIMSIMTLPDNFQTVDKFAAEHKITVADAVRLGPGDDVVSEDHAGESESAFPAPVHHRRQRNHSRRFRRPEDTTVAVAMLSAKSIKLLK